MFSGIVSFVAVFGTLSLLSWSLYSVTVSQISNIEKAFGLSSSESGWLLTVWELGYVICTLFASYFGGRAHQPRVIGIATILCGLSGFVFALPHFIAFSDVNNSDNVKQNETLYNEMSDITMCVNRMHSANDTSNSSSKDLAKISKSSSKALAYALLNIGMILQGAGKAPCYPYSSQYVDDNVDKQKTGFYIGIISSIAVFGLAVGYGVGSLISNIYVTLESTHLLSTDTRFIGAWWLGFVIVSVTTIFIAIPMFCFPRKLKSSETDKIHQHDHRRHTTTATTELKRVACTLHSIIRSPVFVLTLIATCFHVLAFSTFIAFEPKYMETQFSIPPWQANIVLGVVSITSYSIGCLVGGYVTRKWNMSPFNNILCIVVFVAFVTAMLVVTTFLGCGHQEIHNSPTDPTYIGLNCDCSAIEFLPICGSDGNTYFSPCHAGCRKGIQNTLSNCSAITGGVATMGLCPSGCNMVGSYSAAKFVMNLVDAVASIPIFLVFLRAAGEEHKALSIGLSAAITSTAAWLPGPVIGGKLIDSTCLIWNTAPTSGKYCSYYNIEWQRFRLHGLMIGLRVVALVFLTMALFRAKTLLQWPKSEPPLEYEPVHTEAEDNMKPVLQLAVNTTTEHDDKVEIKQI